MVKKKRKSKRKIVETEAWADADWAYADMVATNLMPFLWGPIQGHDKIDRLEEIVGACPEYYPALFDLGNEYINMGEDGAGIRYLERAFESLRNHFSKKDLIEAYYSVCSHLQTRFRFNRAIQYYKLLLEIEVGKDKADVYDSMALCHVYLGDMDEAVKCQRRALEIDSSNVAFYSNMGFLEMMRGNLKDAKKMLEKSLELDKSDDIVKKNYDVCNILLKSREMKNWEDYLLRDADYIKLEELEDEDGWEEIDRLVEDYNSCRLNAFKYHLAGNLDYPPHKKFDTSYTLGYILDFVTGVYEDSYFLYDAVDILEDNFEAIMHKFIFKTGDIDDGIFEDVYTALLEFYGFLSVHRLVSKRGFRRLKKKMMDLKPKLLEKMKRYNEIRRNPDYTEEEKDDIRDELFDGDHEWPFL